MHSMKDKGPKTHKYKKKIQLNREMETDKIVCEIETHETIAINKRKN